MMSLIDKGYYDYDYEPAEIRKQLTEKDKEIWSSEKLKSVLGNIIKPKNEMPSLDEAQEILMKEEELRKKKNT